MPAAKTTPSLWFRGSKNNREKVMVVVKKALNSMLALLLWWPGFGLSQAPVEKIIGVEEVRSDENIKAQKQVERIDDAKRDLVAEYRTVIKIVDGLKVYNGLLEKQITNQHAELTAIQQSIDNVALIERQIVPLMVRMIDSLAAFVKLDVPFLPGERNARVQSLREMMERSDVTVAEKLRRVFEAYQIENDYGRTIEAYKGSRVVDGDTREVNFLRIGRIALLYQTLGGDVSGGWDKDSGEWQTLAPEVYNKSIATGLRIARGRLAPELITVPISAPEVSGR
ncbi:MAG: DUF3450 domain-containing protein [Gammaproteobacteria bacterium]|nr:DUF3450 domain-containing protein [Gammaproteobacteria bacterium]